MIESVFSSEELRAFKAKEAQERMRLIGVGQTGAWRWPDDLSICTPVRPDEIWNLELELAGN